MIFARVLRHLLQTQTHTQCIRYSRLRRLRREMRENLKWKKQLSIQNTTVDITMFSQLFRHRYNAHELWGRNMEANKMKNSCREECSSELSQTVHNCTTTHFVCRVDRGMEFKVFHAERSNGLFVSLDINCDRNVLIQ